MKVGIHNGSASHRLLKLLSKHPASIPQYFKRNYPLTKQSVRSFLVKRGLIKKIPLTKKYYVTELGFRLLEKLSNPPCHRCKMRIDCLCSDGSCRKNFMATIVV